MTAICDTAHETPPLAKLSNIQAISVLARLSRTSTRYPHFRVMHLDRHGDDHESDCRIDIVITTFWIAFFVNDERMGYYNISLSTGEGLYSR
jgi:hypothetical protein